MSKVLSTPRSFSASPPSVVVSDKYLFRNVTLVRVVDGDTILMVARLGFNITREVDVRMLGINAPELHGATNQEGAASKAYLVSLLAAGTQLTVQTYATEKYGRYLAQVWVMVNDVWVNINQRMIEDGYAAVFWI